MRRPEYTLPKMIVNLGNAQSFRRSEDIELILSGTFPASIAYKGSGGIDYKDISDPKFVIDGRISVRPNKAKLASSSLAEYAGDMLNKLPNEMAMALELRALERVLYGQLKEFPEAIIGKDSPILNT
jgi:hypothetical protein